MMSWYLCDVNTTRLCLTISNLFERLIVHVGRFSGFQQIYATVRIFWALTLTWAALRPSIPCIPSCLLPIGSIMCLRFIADLLLIQKKAQGSKALTIGVCKVSRRVNGDWLVFDVLYSISAEEVLIWCGDSLPMKITRTQGCDVDGRVNECYFDVRRFFPWP